MAVNLIVTCNIPVSVILVVAARPYFRQEPGVMITGVLFKFRLNTYFAGLPYSFNIRRVHAPVGAGPDRQVIDNTIWSVLHIRKIVSALPVEVNTAFKFPMRCWVERG